MEEDTLAKVGSQSVRSDSATEGSFLPSIVSSSQRLGAAVPNEGSVTRARGGVALSPMDSRTIASTPPSGSYAGSNPRRSHMLSPILDSDSDTPAVDQEPPFATVPFFTGAAAAPRSKTNVKIILEGEAPDILPDGHRGGGFGPAEHRRSAPATTFFPDPEPTPPRERHCSVGAASPVRKRPVRGVELPSITSVRNSGSFTIAASLDSAHEPLPLSSSAEMPTLKRKGSAFGSTSSMTHLPPKEHFIFPRQWYRMYQKRRERLRAQAQAQNDVDGRPPLASQPLTAAEEVFITRESVLHPPSEDDVPPNRPATPPLAEVAEEAFFAQEEATAVARPAPPRQTAGFSRLQPITETSFTLACHVTSVSELPRISEPAGPLAPEPEPEEKGKKEEEYKLEIPPGKRRMMGTVGRPEPQPPMEGPICMLDNTEGLDFTLLPDHHCLLDAPLVESPVWKALKQMDMEREKARAENSAASLPNSACSSLVDINAPRVMLGPPPPPPRPAPPRDTQSARGRTSANRRGSLTSIETEGRRSNVVELHAVERRPSAAFNAPATRRASKLFFL